MKKRNEKLSRIYRHRFSEEEMIIKEKLWKVLIDDFLQKYIGDYDAVVDIGGGDCNFINNVRCGRKYVVDLNPDTQKNADTDIITIQTNAYDLGTIIDGTINVVFVSNFFEHLKTKDDLDRVITEIKRILTLNGLLLILQPNIRYSYKNYWDFCDHHIPISDRSLVELLSINNFLIKACYPKFLPFSTKNNPIKSTFLLKIYLRFPLLWRVFGKQLFILAQNLPKKT